MEASIVSTPAGRIEPKLDGRETEGCGEESSWTAGANEAPAKSALLTFWVWTTTFGVEITAGGPPTNVDAAKELEREVIEA